MKYKKPYVTPVGTAALVAKENYLKWAKKAFCPDFFLLLTENDRAMTMLNKFKQDNIVLIPIADAVFGVSDYVMTVKNIISQIESHCDTEAIEQIILNSSGGTEKMASIIRDTGDILQSKYPILNVWGNYNNVTKTVVFYNKPKINMKGNN